MAVNNTKTSAAILGGSVNPLQVYQQYQANKQRQQSAAQAEAIKQRDDAIGELRKFNPDKVWDPFYGQVNQFVQKNRESDINALYEGVPPSRVENNSSRWKGDANTLVSKINWLKDQYTDLGKAIDDDDELDPKYYHSKANDLFFNGMQPKPVQEIKTDNAADIFKDSKGYKVNTIVKNFMESLPEKINEHYTKIFGTLGEDYNVQDTKTKLGWEYVTGPDGRQSVVVDPRTGQPKVKMTDDVYVQALTNEKLMNIVNDNLGPEANDTQKKEFLTNLLEGLDPKQIKTRIQVGHKKDEENNPKNFAWGINFGGDVSVLENRRDWLDKITSGSRPDLLSAIGNVSKDIKAEYEYKDKKPVAIKITYPTGTESDDPNYEPTTASVLTSGKRIKTETIPLGTEDQNRAARYKLSEIVDSQLRDSKAAIGTDRYVKYEEAYRANQPKAKGKSVAEQMRELAGKK